MSSRMDAAGLLSLLNVAFALGVASADDGGDFTPRFLRPVSEIQTAELQQLRQKLRNAEAENERLRSFNPVR